MKTILITGASSGIGKQCAIMFAQKGFNLVLISRNIESLKELKEDIQKSNDIEIDCFSCDLSKEDGPNQVFEYCKTNNVKIDVLINNAGFGDYGKFIDGDINKYTNMIDLNDRSLVKMCYLFMNDLKNGGHIINIASIAAFMPGPYMAVYYASKAFVLNFSLAINEELKKDNVRVSAICPGPVRTSFWQKANTSMSETKEKYFARSPKQIANTVFKAYEKRKVVIVDGLINKIIVFFTRFIGRGLLSKIVSNAHNKLLK